MKSKNKENAFPGAERGREGAAEGAGEGERRCEGCGKGVREDSATRTPEEPFGMRTPRPEGLRRGDRRDEIEIKIN